MIASAALRDVCVSLSQLLTSGMGPAEAMRMIAGSALPTLQRDLYAIAKRLDSGTTLSTAMSAASSTFAAPQIAVIRSYEDIGAIGEGFATLAELLEDRIAARRQILRGAIYPLMVLIAHAFLSPVTLLAQSTTAYTAVVIRQLAILAAAVAAAVFGLPRLLGADAAKRVAWRLPWPATVYINHVRAVFCRALGRNLSAGLRLGAALGNAARVTSDPATIEQMRRAEHLLDRSSLAQQLSKAGLVAGTEALLVVSGEESGKLAESLSAVGDRYAEARQRGQRILMTAVGALLTLVVVAVAVSSLLEAYQSLTGGAEDMLRQIDADSPIQDMELPNLEIPELRDIK